MDRKLKFMFIGAHPDDCDIRAAGFAMKLVKAGHEVMFLSATDGSAGHHEMTREGIRDRRKNEMAAVAAFLGIRYENLPYLDGCLEADLKTREDMMRAIRRFSPDLIFTHRTNDYHPDHRNTGILVQDCAYLLRVPLCVPDTPPMKTSPCILFFRDGFTHPYPFTPDLALPIDDVMDRKVESLLNHESQFIEWLPWADGEDDIANAPTMEEKRRLVGVHQKERDHRAAEEAREVLIREYGPEKGAAVQYAETFEVSEYGDDLTDEVRNIILSLA